MMVYSVGCKSGAVDGFRVLYFCSRLITLDCFLLSVVFFIHFCLLIFFFLFFFFSSRRRHTRSLRGLEFRRVLFRSSSRSRSLTVWPRKTMPSGTLSVSTTETFLSLDSSSASSRSMWRFSSLAKWYSAFSERSPDRKSVV